MKGKVSGPLYVAMMGVDVGVIPSLSRLSINLRCCISNLAIVDLPEYSETA